jgi:hypothetical protein
MLGLNPDSPAFTCLEKRMTFIEESLVDKVRDITSKLVARWHMGTVELLKTAIEHEMGHALCNCLDEDKANYIAQNLEHNRSISIQATPR